METFYLQNSRKTKFWRNRGPIGSQKGTKICPPGGPYSVNLSEYFQLKKKQVSCESSGNLLHSAVFATVDEIIASYMVVIL